MNDDRWLGDFGPPKAHMTDRSKAE